MPRTAKAKDKAQHNRRCATSLEVAQKDSRREAKKQEDLRVSHDAAISAQCNFFNPKHIGSNGKAAVNAEIDAQGINFNNAPYEDSQHDGEAGNTDGIEEDIADGEASDADSIEEDVARPDFFNSKPPPGATCLDSETGHTILCEVRPVDIEIACDDVDEVVEVTGVMRVYLKAVFHHLRSERSGVVSKNVQDKWLIKIFIKNDWWLKASVHSWLICH